MDQAGNVEVQHILKEAAEVPLVAGLLKLGHKGVDWQVPNVAFSGLKMEHWLLLEAK